MDFRVCTQGCRSLVKGTVRRGENGVKGEGRSS